MRQFRRLFMLKYQFIPKNKVSDLIGIKSNYLEVETLCSFIVYYSLKQIKNTVTLI